MIPSRTLSNSYDQRSQLISEQQQETGGPLGTTIRTRSETHRYDAAENRLSTMREINDPQSGASTLQRSFTYGNAANGYNSNQLYQLTETLDAGAPLTSTFGYDPNGNRSSKATASLTDTYTYDSFNRLTGLELNTAAPAENGSFQYRYDPLTRRIARITGAIPSAANTYQFAFSGSSPVHEWDGDISNTSYHQQRTGSGVGGLLQTQEADGTATHPRHNLRGDITAQFSASGTLLWHGSYASNGMLNHQYQYGTRDRKYGANGKYEEPAGLLNEGFRYRDRLTNTFITRDPAGFIDGPNDYNYVRHNPWSAWDPNGLATVLLPAPDSNGYISPDAFKSTVVPPAMDGNSLSNQTTPISQNGYQGGAGSSQTLPVAGSFPAMEYWDLLSAIVEANAEPITISNAPTNIWLLLSEGSHEQLVQAMDSGKYDPETKRAIENAIESRANGAHNWAVVSGTAQGLTMILNPESVVFKGAAIGFIGLKSLGRSAVYAERLGAFGIRSESAAAKGMVASLEETVGSFNLGYSRTLNYSFAAKGPVKPYEVGTADDLWARSVKGDGMDVHHAGQAHPMEQLVPGYDRAKGPAITVPRGEHVTIPTVRGPVSGTPRSQLSKDIWDLRNNTNAPNSNLQELIDLNKTMYPNSFKK